MTPEQSDTIKLAHRLEDECLDLQAKEDRLQAQLSELLAELSSLRDERILVECQRVEAWSWARQLAAEEDAKTPGA